MPGVAKAFVIGTLALFLFCFSGCGGDDGPLLAEAGGTVKYNGEPLAGANVVFTPEEGPVAVGTTDDQGHFVLSTRGEPGAMVGPHKVAVRALEPSNEAAEDESGERPKSRIPEKFGNPTTSGLTETVSENAAENDFTFDLQD